MKYLALVALVVGTVFIGRWSKSSAVMAQDRAVSGATSQPVALSEPPGRFRTVYFELDQDHAMIDSETGRVWHLTKGSDGNWALQELRRIDLKQ